MALVARYHRRTPPERGRPDLEGLSPSELRLVRRLVALLRVADALDRSHHQPVKDVRARGPGRAVQVSRGRAGPSTSSCGTWSGRGLSSGRSSGEGWRSRLAGRG